MSNTILEAARAALPDAQASVSDDLAIKQLVHGQLLRSMDATGLLDTSTFQGGSAISNCYGGIRLSEGLDFCVASFPDEAQAEAFAADVKRGLLHRFGAEASVELPKMVREAGSGSRVPVSRFRVKLPYVERRPDIPWIYVKLELAKIARSTSVPLEIDPLVSIEEARELRPIVLVEKAAEIVADKVISFAGTTSWLRTRDLFDMHWLLTRETVDDCEVFELVEKKLQDYELDGKVLLETVRVRREQLYGPVASVEALSELRGMLVDVAWAERLSTPRGAMSIVGRALDCSESALAHAAAGA